MPTHQTTYLDDLWNKARLRAWYSAEDVRGWIRLTLYSGILLNGLYLLIMAVPWLFIGASGNYRLLLSALGADTIVAAIFFVTFTVFFYVTLRVRYLLTRSPEFTVDHAALDPLPAKREVAVRQILDVIAPVLGVDPTKIRLWMNVFDGAREPSIAEAEGEIHVVLPIGFFKLQKDPQDWEAAKAMLAHEITHVAQRDSDTWFYASAFSRYALRVLLPIACIPLLAVLVLGLLNGMQHSNEVSASSTASSISLINEDSRLEERSSSNGSNVPWAVSVLVVSINPAVLLWTWYVVRNGRRASEIAADMGAVLVGSEGGIKTFLSWYAEDAEYDAKMKASWFHPSPTFRLKQVNHYASFPKREASLSSFVPLETKRRKMWQMTSLIAILITLAVCVSLGIQIQDTIYLYAALGIAMLYIIVRSIISTSMHIRSGGLLFCVALLNVALLAVVSLITKGGTSNTSSIMLMLLIVSVITFVILGALRIVIGYLGRRYTY